MEIMSLIIFRILKLVIVILAILITWRSFKSIHQALSNISKIIQS